MKWFRSTSVTLGLILFLSWTLTPTPTTAIPFEEDDEELIKELELLLKKGSSANDDIGGGGGGDTLPGSDQGKGFNSGETLPEDLGLLGSSNSNNEADNFNEIDDDYPQNLDTQKALPSPDAGQDSTSEGVDCLCKKYFECNLSGNDLDGSGTTTIPSSSSPYNDSQSQLAPMELDIRLGDTVGSQCGHYFDICCDSVRENVTSIRNPPYRHSTCGKRNLSGVGFRITGDLNQESQFGEFPWMTAIVAPEGSLNVFVCGGSLIHPRVVLTAAHCVYKRSASTLTVRLGEWDTQTSDEVYRHKDISVSKLIIHEDFYSGALYNDIALLILSEESPFAPNIDTVCLPPTNLNFDGERCFASGWGRDSYGAKGNYQVILKKVELPVVSRNYCEYRMKSTRLGSYFQLHPSFVCAGGEKGKDTCRGDGGSPLVCKVPGTEDIYVQYGIVAWGIGCGEEGIPGVYVNVPMFVPWITRKLNAEKFDTKYFKLSRQSVGK